MKDKEAIEEIAPCFPERKPYYRKDRKMWIISKYGKGAYDLLQKMPRTTERRRKDQDCLKKCQKLWMKHYIDRIP